MMRGIAGGLFVAIAPLMAALPVQAASVSVGGSTLSATSVPPPGIQGYVYYAALNPIGGTQYSPITPIGLATNSDDLASPVPYVTIDTTGDQYYTTDNSGQTGGYGGYTDLTVSGTSYQTGVAYQAVSLGGTATLATMTLAGPGLPKSFQLGILDDNAPGPQNDQAAIITVTGSNNVTQPVAGNLGGPHNDFYYFDISNITSGDILTISVQNNGANGSVIYSELGGFTFDAVPVPLPAAAGVGFSLLGAFGALAALRKRLVTTLRIA